jgi:hypothetical protein
MRTTLASLLFSLTVLPACTAADDGATESATDAASDASTGATDGPTTGETVDLNDRELGASASMLCRDAMTHASKLTQAITSGDAAAASAAYLGTDLQTYVQQFKTEVDRQDDPAIVASLALASPAGLAAAEGRLHAALARHLRDQLSAVEGGAEDKYAAWDEAHCVWTGALRSLALAGDAVTWHSVDETIVADIDDAFAAGHDGLSGEPPATALDDWRVPASKQIIEKSLFRAAQRNLIDLATAARDNDDEVAARRAHALFGVVEDRLDGRNTPGIAQIQAMLSGEPAAIDPDTLLTELDIAFAKRTRAYAAIADEDLGVPAGYKSAVEGRTYARLIAPGLAARVPTADVAAFLGEWEAYPELVRAGTDLETIHALSQRLVDTVCAYQAALGVAACTPEADETE